MSEVRRRFAVVSALCGAVLLVGVSACSSTSSSVRIGPPVSSGPRALTDSPIVHIAEGDRTSQPYDAFLARVVDDLQAFWRSSYPTISGGRAYHDLSGGVWPVWPTAQGVPGCGERRTRYREIQNNAFYCPDRDFIAFDDTQLFPDLDRRFGEFTLAMVLAHEWGHSIQQQRAYGLQGVVTELQADCFAGAWMGHVQSGKAKGLELKDADLRRAISGILEFRDDPGTSSGDRGAHGSAFDRLGSFQDGLQGGVRKCDSYTNSPPVVLELPFNDASATAPSSDLTLDRLVTTVPPDLDRFWHLARPNPRDALPTLSRAMRPYPKGGPYPTCQGLTTTDYESGVVYCPSPEFIGYEDGGENAHLLDTIGGFSVGVLFADRWAEALQHHAGVTSAGDRAELQRDCLTGAWVADVVPHRTGTQPFTISPGDLDEAVRTYLTLTDGGNDSARAALARIGSFRGGLFSGVDSCGLPG